MTLKTYAKVEPRNGVTALILDPSDRLTYDKILGDAVAKGKRVEIQIKTGQAKDKTPKQAGLYWALLTLLFRTVNGRSPTEAEKLELHDDLKAQYALRRPSRLHPETLVPIGLSESDTEDASTMIDGVMAELGSLDLTWGQQSDARSLWFQYWELGGPRWSTEPEFREKAIICAACGKGGVIQLAHIRSRGASKAQQDDPNNWLPLCPNCHGASQHQHGWPTFLRQYPHLRRRVEEILGEVK